MSPSRSRNVRGKNPNAPEATPTEPASRLRTPIPPSLRDLLDDLESAAAIGALPRALGAILSYGDSRLQLDLESRSWDDQFRMHLACTAFEILAAAGEDRKARLLLQPYLDNPVCERGLLAARIPVRAKLQLAEAHCSTRDVDRATEIAETILGGLSPGVHGWEIGEAAYYLFRYSIRRYKRRAARGHDLMALEAFTSAGPALGKGPAVEWRLGLLHLSEASARWQSGRLNESRALLSSALFHLRRTEDIVAIGDAEQMLGCIVRSQGAFAEARQWFHSALKRYEEARHRLNIARVHTNLARLDVLIGMNGGDVSLKDVLSKLERARAMADGVTAPEQQDPVWLRQELEAAIWESSAYLHFRHGGNVSEARSCAMRARDLARRIDSPWNDIEATIALGYCAMHERNMSGARSFFQEALSAAEAIGSAKLAVNALLSLAELECRTPSGDLRSASRQYVLAMERMREVTNERRRAAGRHRVTDEKSQPKAADAIWFSAYLVMKARRVQVLLRSARVLILLPEDLGHDPDQFDLAGVIDRARQWAIAAALERAKGSKTRAAWMLRMTRQAIYQAQSRTAVSAPKTPGRRRRGKGHA